MVAPASRCRLISICRCPRIHEVSSSGRALCGLAVHRELPEHDPGLLVDHREQMPPEDLGPVTVDVAGAAHGLAVEREHAAPPGRSPPAAQTLHERADHHVEPITASTRSASTFPEQPADRRVPRATPVGPPVQPRRRQAGRPPTRRPRRTTAHQQQPHTPPRSAPRPGHGEHRGAGADRPPRPAPHAGPPPAPPDRVAPGLPSGRRQQRSTEMTASTHRDFADPRGITLAARQQREHQRAAPPVLPESDRPIDLGVVDTPPAPPPLGGGPRCSGVRGSVVPAPGGVRRGGRSVRGAAGSAPGPGWTPAGQASSLSNQLIS